MSPFHVIVTLTLGALTVGSAVFRHMRLLRILCVASCWTVAVFIGFGLSNAARFGMIEDRVLLNSTTRYGDAYKAGLLAAQRTVDRDWPTCLVVSFYLGVLALVPVSRRQKK